jgi:hypothetical protein
MRRFLVVDFVGVGSERDIGILDVVLDCGRDAQIGRIGHRARERRLRG